MQLAYLRLTGSDPDWYDISEEWGRTELNDTLREKGGFKTNRFDPLKRLDVVFRHSSRVVFSDSFFQIIPNTD